MHDAGSRCAQTPAQGSCSARNVRASLSPPPSRALPPREAGPRHRWVARMRRVEHLHPHRGNPDASRAPRPRTGWLRWRERANGAAARHAPRDRGHSDSDLQLRAAPRAGKPASRRRCNSAGRGRNGCKATPARGIARTGTCGLEFRPVARLLGTVPEEVASLLPSTAVDWRRIRCHGAVKGTAFGSINCQAEGPAP
jgi:hypothetical protein